MSRNGLILRGGLENRGSSRREREGTTEQTLQSYQEQGEGWGCRERWPRPGIGGSPQLKAGILDLSPQGVRGKQRFYF